jgi:hypothetical protein
MTAVALQGRRLPLPAASSSGERRGYVATNVAVPAADGTAAGTGDVPQMDPARFPPAVCRLLEACWVAEPQRRLDAGEVARKCRALVKRIKEGVPLY